MFADRTVNQLVHDCLTFVPSGGQPRPRPEWVPLRRTDVGRKNVQHVVDKRGDMHPLHRLQHDALTGERPDLSWHRRDRCRYVAAITHVEDPTGALDQDRRTFSHLRTDLQHYFSIEHPRVVKRQSAFRAVQRSLLKPKPDPHPIPAENHEDVSPGSPRLICRKTPRSPLIAPCRLVIVAGTL